MDDSLNVNLDTCLLLRIWMDFAERLDVSDIVF